MSSEVPMSTLQEIITKIKQKEKEADMDVAAAPYAVRAGTESLVRNAKEELVLLKKQYRDSVMKSSMVISVSGPGSEEFGAVARKNFKMLAFDSDDLAKYLEDKLRARGVREDFGSNENHFLMTELVELRTTLELSQLPPLNPESGYGKPLAVAIRNVLAASYGSDLSQAYVRRKVEAEALEARFAGKTLGIIVSGFPDDNFTFLPGPAFRIRLSGQSVTKKLVGDELQRIKSSISKKPEVTVTENQNQEEQNVKEN